MSRRPARPRQRPAARRPPALAIGLTIGAAALAVFIQARSGAERPIPSAPVIRYGYAIVNVYPHDPLAFTQGLIYRDGYLFESTGLQGRSSVRKVRLEDGAVVQHASVEATHFAEGLTDWGNRLVQITWQSNLGFVYDAVTFQVQRTFSYSGEGWGLTRDQSRLIMSDGTERLRFFDPSTFRETGHLTVRDGELAVHNLNELEVVKGEIYANIWQTDEIVTIDPGSGRVTGRIDLSGLLSPSDRARSVDVLNGIAHDPGRDRLFVTGKLWPKLFEIRLERRE